MDKASELGFCRTSLRARDAIRESGAVGKAEMARPGGGYRDMENAYSQELGVGGVGVCAQEKGEV